MLTGKVESLHVILKVMVKIEYFKISFIFSFLLKAFKIKSILRFNFNRCFYYNIHAFKPNRVKSAAKVVQTNQGVNYDQHHA